MKWKVPLFDVAFGAEEEQAVLGVLRSGWLSAGEVTRKFERAFGEKLGCDDAIAVASGTAALHLAVRALWIGAGDEVILSDLAFVSTANAVLYEGATPVFADVVGEHDLTLDPTDVERKVTEDTRAIIATHYGGYPCDMTALVAIAEKYGLAIIEDVSRAPGALYGGRACGTLGHAGCFSFHATASLATGEGGMITPTDPDHARRVRALRSHAMTAQAPSQPPGRAWGYDLVEIGYNYRFNEIGAALALAQLARLDAGNARRASLTARYHELLGRVSGIEVPFGPRWADAQPPGTQPSCHLLEVLLPDGADRAHVQDRLTEAGVQTSVHYRPLHTLSSPLIAAAPAEGLTQIDAVSARLLTLPLWPGMSDTDVDLVVESLSSAL